MSNKIIIHKLNEVFLKIDCDCDQGHEISEHFSCFVPGYKFMPLYKAGCWAGKSSFFNFNDSTLPIGFLSNLLSFCKSFNYEYEFTFDINTLTNNVTDEQITDFLKKILPPEGKYQLRDYQEVAVREMIKNKRCLIDSATGSGKSLIIYCVVKYFQTVGLKGKFVLIVPTISLVSQMESDFKDYGYDDFEKDFGTIFFDSSNRDLSKQYLISTWQTLHKLPQSFFSSVEAFFVDEVHSSSFKSKLLVNVLANMNNAHYRMGCTGSLPSEKINMGSLIGYIGKTVSTVKSQDLIEKGILANIQILNILLKYPESMIDKSGNFQDEVEKIIHYTDRNKVFKYLVNKVGDNKNILILVQRIEHLRSVKQYLENEFPNKKIYEVYGGTESTVRENVRKIVNVNKGSIICATFKTFGTGINIPNLNVVIFGSSYKSSQVVIQSIGRGLRKTETKTKMTLIDIVDDLTWKKKNGGMGTNYLYLHFLERLKIYRSQGFPYKNISLNISDI